MDPSLPRDGAPSPSPPPMMPLEKAATAVQYDDLTGGDVGGGGEEAGRRPPASPYVLRVGGLRGAVGNVEHLPARSLARRRVKEAPPINPNIV